MMRKVGKQIYRNIINITLLTLFVFVTSANAQVHKGSKSVISSVDSVQSLKEFNTDIKRILSDKNLKRTSIGMLIYSLDNQKVYYEKNMDEYFTPASVTKIITSFSALVTLGPDFPVKTLVYSDSLPNDGILNGNLYLVGHGDALLSTSDIEKLTDQIYSYGIREIRGDIIGDGTFFDDETSRFKYSGDADVVQSIPPITALSVEKNEVTVMVTAGPVNNKPVTVNVIPPSDAFSVDVDATVFGASQNRRRGEIDNNEMVAPENEYLYRMGDQLYSNLIMKRTKDEEKLKIRVYNKKDGTQSFSVSGGLKSNKTSSKSYEIKDPVLVAAGTLINRLKLRGISVKGTYKSQKRPEYAKNLVAEFSRPLKEILAPLNKNSDNYLAESVFKMIGANSSDNPNTALASRNRTKHIIDSLGIPCKKCMFNDGSGLSRRNLVSPDALVRILEIAGSSYFADDFKEVLSSAGIDGTLEKRMRGTLAENNLKAKTGTLRNVSALAGYLNTLDGEKIAFAFFFNGPAVGAYKRTEDMLGKLMAQFFFYNDIE